MATAASPARTSVVVAALAAVGALGALWWLGSSGSFSPGADDWTEPTLVERTNRELKVEGKTYPFIERVYRPGYLLPTDAPPAADALITPERTLARYAKAILDLDWETSQAMYDPASRSLLAADLKKRGQGPADRLKIWEPYRGAQLELYKRVDMAPYVMVWMGKVGEPPADRERVIPLVLRKDDAGRWWMTHELRKHPVAMKDVWMPEGAVLK